MKNLFFCFYLGLLSLFSTLYAQDTSSFVLYFANDSYQLDASQEAKLRDRLAAHHAASLYISGHTDGRASDVYNEKLAAQRVKSVQAFILQLGFSPDSLRVASFGEREPVADNATETGRAQNRRVEVFWVAKSLQQPQTTIADLYHKIAQKPQLFWLRADQERDTIIEAKHGTRFLIPRGAFRCNSHFDYNKQIRFEVKEFLTAGEMLQGNLHSMSGGKPLQTGGMLHIAAFQGEQPIELCEDRPISFFVPSAYPMSNMYRFDGVETARKGLDWEQGDSLRVFGLPTSANIDEQDTIFNRVHFAASLENHIEKLPNGQYDNTFTRMVNSFRRLSGIINSDTNFYYNKTNGLFYSLQWAPSDGLQWTPSDGACSMWDYDPITGEAYVEEWSTFTLYVDNPPVICDTILPIPTPVAPPLSAGVEQLVNGASGYLGKTANLGNINCDRFMRGNFMSQRISVRTDVLVDSTTDIKLIIPSVKGIMSSSSRWLPAAKTFSFPRVPADLHAVLMGLRYKKGKAYLAVSRITTNSSIQTLNFEPISEEEIPFKLAQIGF